MATPWEKRTPSPLGLALTGRHRVAQGNALGKANAVPPRFSPERAAQGQTVYTALSGLRKPRDLVPRSPRALPWATLCRPFGAPDLGSRYVPAPRALPWATL